MRIVILGLSITSSWGNGHATTFRGLAQELNRRGHDVLFLERDQEWYAKHRDLPSPPYCRTELYSSLQDLSRRFTGEVRDADCVLQGSYVPEGIAVGEWVTTTADGVTAFYDIDTPVTLAKLQRQECDYIAPHLISRFDVYLSFTGGPTLELLEKRYGSPRACAFYCSVDPAAYYPTRAEVQWDMGYLGTYSFDRQPPLDLLLTESARLLPEQRFIVAGPLYPETIAWPRNVERVHHIAPAEHRTFYNSQRFTLNVTRADMIRAGYSPSVRLFEAAACGAPIISDAWEGLDTLLEPGREILIVKSTQQVVEILRDMPEEERAAIGRRGRERILSAHTAAHRAVELEQLVHSIASSASHTTENTQIGTPKLQTITL